MSPDMSLSPPQSRHRHSNSQEVASTAYTPRLPVGCGQRESSTTSLKALPKPLPNVPASHWMLHLSLSRAWPSRRTLALMYLRSLLTLGRRAKGETMP